MPEVTAAGLLLGLVLWGSFVAWLCANVVRRQRRSGCDPAEWERRAQAAAERHLQAAARVTAEDWQRAGERASRRAHPSQGDDPAA